MATRENKNVILDCPYGSFRPFRSTEAIVNGTRGVRIGGVIIASPIVEFEGHKPCNVPEAWLLTDHHRNAVAQIQDDKAHPVSAGWRRVAEAQADQLQRIADALGTDERGEALVEIARTAHRAEQELAALLCKVRGGMFGDAEDHGAADLA